MALYSNGSSKDVDRTEKFTARVYIGGAAHTLVVTVGLQRTLLTGGKAGAIGDCVILRAALGGCRSIARYDLALLGTAAGSIGNLHIGIEGFTAHITAARFFLLALRLLHILPLPFAGLGAANL